MTLLSKSGASTAGDPTVPGAYNKKYDPNEPPSYDDTMSGAAAQGLASAASTSAAAAAPTPKPTNFANDSRSMGNIEGSWIIDTDIEVPPALLAPLPWLQSERPNLSLHTGSGTVKANVSLTSGSSKRAFIKTNTSYGAVTVIVSSRANDQPVKILANSSYGSMKIGIPRTFVGPIKFKTAWGNIHYSETIRANTSTFSEKTGFIGDWQKSGFVDHKKWTGDILEVTTSYGDISFYYADEVPEDGIKEDLNGIWNSVVGWFGTHKRK